VKHRLSLLCLAGTLAAAAPLHTAIKAEHYEALKDVLAQGDVVFAFAVRDREGDTRPPKTIWNDRKFTQRVAALDAIHDTRVEKAVVLSSLEDFKAARPRIPKDVGWIMYNTEPGMTPAGEMEHIEDSVAEFARLAHAAGMRLDWAPIGMLPPDVEARYLALAPQVDGFLLQHQKVLEGQGVDAFVELTRKRAETIRKLNPKCRVTVQVVIGRGTTEDLITALRRVAGMVDATAIWTMQDTAGAAKILAGARGQ
jgi:hypothetical protein